VAVRHPIPPDARAHLHEGDPDTVTKKESLSDTELVARNQAAEDAKQRLDSLKAQTEPNQSSSEKKSSTKDAQDENLLKVDFRFGKDEEEAITTAVAKLSTLADSGPWGPRSVRAFVFRYQLARMLAIRLCGKDWTPKLICELMVQQSSPDQKRELAQTHTKLAKIVSQVA
jgi:hypothetical protein